MKINNANLDALLRGASVLACGGGLSFREQQRLAATASVQGALNAGVKLLAPLQIKPDEFVATVSEVGAADAPVMDKAGLPAALQLLQEKTGKKIAALIPGEVGQEAIMLDSAITIGLPIVDADFSGCRAVPKLTDSILLRQGVPFTMSPLVVLFADGSMQFVAQQKSLKKDEKIIRSLVPDGEIVTILGGLVSGEMVQRFLDNKSYTLAMKLGKVLQDNGDITQVIPSAKLFGPVDVVVKKVREVTSKGFNKKRVVLRSKKGLIRVVIQNEFMICSSGEQEFAFPQMIMMLDELGTRGLHSSEVVEGVRVKVVVADAFAFWKEEA